MQLVKRVSIICFLTLCGLGSFAQTAFVTLSGMVKDNRTKTSIPYVNVVVKNEKDSAFVSGTVTGEDGRFTLEKIKPGSYFLEISFMGYETKLQPLFIGILNGAFMFAADLFKIIHIDAEISFILQRQVM